MASSITGALKGFKEKARKEVHRLTQPPQPRPGQAGYQQQPSQGYGQQQVLQQPQIQGSQGIQASQSPQFTQYQQYSQQQQVQQPQYAPVQVPLTPGHQYVAGTSSQPQLQNQTPIQVQPPYAQVPYQHYKPQPQGGEPQTSTSPQPQSQCQFQPQYQYQNQQQVSPIQSQQYVAPIPQTSPVQYQYQYQAPQSQPLQQIHPQQTPTPPVQYSPVSAAVQTAGRRQSYIVPQQQSQPSPSPPIYQTSVPVSAGPVQTQVLYQSQPIQSPVSSLARLSLHSSSPVQFQQSPSQVYYQPTPPTGPPPAHLQQDPPPPLHSIQSYNDINSYVPSPVHSFASVQNGPQTHVSSAIPPVPNPVPTPIQAQQSSPSLSQVSQTPVLNNSQLTQTASQHTAFHQTPVQPQTQTQQYIITHNATPPLSYEQTSNHQLSQAVSPIATPPIRQDSASSIAIPTQAQLMSSQSPIQQPYTASGLPQSQFHGQIRNSVRRKPHPGTSHQSAQLQQSSASSQSAGILPPVTEFQSIPTGSAINDHSLYQSPPQLAPVELDAQAQAPSQGIIGPSNQPMSTSSPVPTVIDLPLIESEIKNIETVAPKPIHPPPQYEAAAPVQQISQSDAYPRVQDHESLSAENSIVPQTVYAQTSSQNYVPAPTMDEALPIVESMLVTHAPIKIDVSNHPSSSTQPPQSFILPDDLLNEKMPAHDEEDASMNSKPSYKAFVAISSPSIPEKPPSAPLSSDGRQQYLAYSPESQQPKSAEYFPRLTQSQIDSTSSSPTRYRAYSVSTQKALEIPDAAIQHVSPPAMSKVNETQSSQLHTNNSPQKRVGEEVPNAKPIPPTGPCPEHLRNQTPPPASYFEHSQVSAAIYCTEPQVEPFTIKPVELGQLPLCTGKKQALTKYNQFYTWINEISSTELDTPQLAPWAICQACYTAHISQNLEFSRSFHLFISPDAVKCETDDVAIPTSRLFCQFGLFTMLRETFQTQCLPQGTLAPLIASIQHLNALPPCPGNDIMNGGEYYTASKIPDSTFCSQCFDAHIKPTIFARNFTMKLNGPGQQWKCNNGQDPGYSSRLLLSCLSDPVRDFNYFADNFNLKLQLPPCSGVASPLSASVDGLIHVFVLPGLDLTVCIECFYERISLTTFEQNFVPKEFDPSSSSVECDLGSEVSRFLFMTALETKDLSIWHEGIKNFNRVPKCENIKGVAEEDIQAQLTVSEVDAAWYCVTAYPSIEVCPCCFYCAVKPRGGAHLFTAINRQLRAGVVRTCSFSVGNGGIVSLNQEDFPYTLYFRGFLLRHLIDIAWESKQQDFSPFMSIAKALSLCGPACGSNVRGYKRPNGRRWFGHVATDANDANDCTVVMCQECYEDYIKDTNLDSALGRDLTEEVYAGDPQNEKEAFCGPFSKRSKSVLKEAKESNDWTIFARHWNHRQMVRDSTLPLIEALQGEFMTQNMMKMSAMTNATLVKGGAGILEATGTDGLDHGNSVVGYGYGSEAGVDAAMWQRNADNTKWGDLSIFVKIGMLEQQWKAVE